MMRWFYVVRAGVRSLLGRRAFDDQLSADLRFHLIRPSRIPRSVRQAGTGDAGDRGRAVGARIANLASLFLARAATRQLVLSVCLALGASRTRLARQVLSETLSISMAGGALGVLAAWWGVDVLIGFLPEFGASTDLQIHPDRNVLLFSLTAAMLTGLGIGLAPALLARRIDIRNMLSAGARTVALGGAAFKALIVVQVALSTVLVVAATLFSVTLNNLKTQSLGFVADGVLTLTVDAAGTEFEGARLSEVHRQLLQKLQALPGVQHASFATIPPLSSNVDGKPISILPYVPRAIRRSRHNPQSASSKPLPQRF